MKITFLGTGTSLGVPIVGCPCDVCSSTDSRDKRMRSSVYVEIDGKNLVIDTGPDFRTQLLNNNIKRVDAILITHQHRDCGAMIFDAETQDTHCGGSGCGCGASVLCGHFLPMLEREQFHDILFAATGALMSPMSIQQGESIPCISHLVHLRKD